MTDRMIFGRIPFGAHHDRILGRILWMLYRYMHAFVFVCVMVGIIYRGNYEAINRDTLIASLALMSVSMEGSMHTRDKRVRDYVLSHLEDEEE